MKRSLVILFLLPGLFATLAAAEIPADEQRQLAQQYAPVLVFHPEETNLPCSPEIWRAQAANEDLSGPTYKNASLEEKGRNSVVFYRVFDRGEQRILEYWLYYANDSYRAGGGLFPFWSDASHFNDLEFIFLILGREPSGDGWRVEKIIASAHEINNIHKMGSVKAPHEVRFLVELGSHAMAPDLNSDGRFTPSLEGRSNSKIVWGIRDYGSIWARYASSLGAARTAESAIFLYPKSSGEQVSSFARQYFYSLESITGITQSSFEWTDRLPRNSRSWVSSFFGKPDGSSKSLAIPPMHPNYGKPGRAEYNQSALERGFFFGYTPILYDYTLLGGYRYTQPSHSRYVPDAVIDSYALLCGNGNDYYEVQVTGAYPVDAISSLFGGLSILGDSIGFDDHQVSWVGGLEVRLNRFRFRTSIRDRGKVSSAWLDFRLMWFF